MKLSLVFWLISSSTALHRLRGGTNADFKYFCSVVKDARSEFDVSRASRGRSTSIFRMYCLDRGFGKWEYRVSDALKSVHNENPRVIHNMDLNL